MALSSESLPPQHRQCSYVGQLSGCEERAEPGSAYCFWHCPEADKSGQDVKERLERRARTGKPMEGFRLCNALLDNINLVNRDGEPFQLVNSDLSRASLHKAHLYRLDLSGSSLFKTNLSHANLHRTSLSGCNLLGANLKNSLLDHVNWGGKLYQELMAEEKPEQASL
ncbi:MAG: pentapeptide repeat-containing protein, partial [Endozoicomonas sp.]